LWAMWVEDGLDALAAGEEASRSGDEYAFAE
jgi:hypothetical protein